MYSKIIRPQDYDLSPQLPQPWESLKDCHNVSSQRKEDVEMTSTGVDVILLRRNHVSKTPLRRHVPAGCQPIAD